MVKLAFGGVLLVGLAMAAGNIEAAKPRPDCTNVYANGASFTTIDKVCAQITDPQLFEASFTLNELAKLETVETCSCALLNHELAWASLMTHEASMFYRTIKKFIEGRAATDKAMSELTQGDRAELFRGDEGQRRFYWDGIDHILRSATGVDDDDAISLELRKHLVNIYYDTNTFSPWQSQSLELLVNSQKLRIFMSDTCHHVLNKFATPLIFYFDRLSRLAENSRLLYTLASYDDNLYKLRIITRVCSYLQDKNQILPQTRH